MNSRAKSFLSPQRQRIQQQIVAQQRQQRLLSLEKRGQEESRIRQAEAEARERRERQEKVRRQRQSPQRQSPRHRSPFGYSNNAFAQTSSSDPFADDPFSGPKDFGDAETTDDEMTLTNMRQIVGAAHDATRDMALSRRPPPPRQPQRYDESQYYSGSEDKNTAAARHAPAIGAQRLTRTCSSSDYETDNGSRALQPDPTFSNMSASQMTPDVASFFEKTSKKYPVASSKMFKDHDDDTYDYGDRDEDEDDEEAEITTAEEQTDGSDYGSVGSLSYTERTKRRQKKEREVRQAAAAAAKAQMEANPFMKTDDVEHYRRVVDTPLGRTAAGVAAAATVGCVVLGPVGLLVGAAAVGIGVGYMQIPEQERKNMNEKATVAARQLHESALNASEKMSTSCAATYRDSGVSDHVPVEIQSCCTTLVGMDEPSMSLGDSMNDPEASVMDASEVNDEERKRSHGGEGGGRGKANETVKRQVSPSHSTKRLRDKKGKVACLRKGKVFAVVALCAPLRSHHALLS